MSFLRRHDDEDDDGRSDKSAHRTQRILETVIVLVVFLHLLFGFIVAADAIRSSDQYSWYATLANILYGVFLIAGVGCGYFYVFGRNNPLHSYHSIASYHLFGGLAFVLGGFALAEITAAISDCYIWYDLDMLSLARFFSEWAPVVVPVAMVTLLKVLHDHQRKRLYPES